MEQRGGVLVLAALADDGGLAERLRRRAERLGGLLGQQRAKLLAGVDQRREIVHELPGKRILQHRHRGDLAHRPLDRKSTRLNSSHLVISYAVFCLKKKKKNLTTYYNKKKKKKQT